MKDIGNISEVKEGEIGLITKLSIGQDGGTAVMEFSKIHIT